MMKYLLATAAAVGFASAASAADLYTAPPVVEEPGIVVAPDFNWTGFYAGVQAGYGWANHDFSAEAGLLSESFDVDADGWLAGINVGADWQINQSWVVGLMADYNWSDIDGTGSATVFTPLDGHIEQESSWNILARAGYLVTPQTLVYVLGGYSQADVHWGYDNNDDGIEDEGGSEDLDGWTLGVGAEAMFTPNISAKAEYRYTAWDDIDFAFNGGAGSGSVDSDQHSVLIGLNFRWGVTP